MDPKDKERLRKNHVLLVDDLDFNHIVTHILSSGLISVNEMEEINAKEPRTRRTQNLTFLLMLPKKGRGAYKLFHDCLDVTGYQHLREALDETDVSLTADDWFAHLPNEVQAAVPTEKQLSSIAKNIGLGWEVIGGELGLSQAEIDQCKMRHPHSPVMQILTMFNKWKTKNGSLASMALLASALSDNSVYNDTFRNILASMRYAQESYHA